MYKFIIFIILTIGFGLMAKAQTVERYLDTDNAKTTVIEKVPGSDDREILNSLDMGGFSLTDQVYIKDYENKPVDAQPLPQKQQELTAVPVKERTLQMQVRTRSVAADIPAEPNEIAYTESADLTANTSGPAAPSAPVNRTAAAKPVTTKYVYIDNTTPRKRTVKRSAPAPKVAEKVQVENSRTIAMREARAAAEYRKNKTERNPVGEKVKRKKIRVPKWNSDRRGSGGILKCFSFQ